MHNFRTLKWLLGNGRRLDPKRTKQHLVWSLYEDLSAQKDFTLSNLEYSSLLHIVKDLAPSDWIISVIAKLSKKGPHNCNRLHHIHLAASLIRECKPDAATKVLEQMGINEQDRWSAIKRLRLLKLIDGQSKTLVAKLAKNTTNRVFYKIRDMDFDWPGDPFIPKDAVAIKDSVIDKELELPGDRSIMKDEVAINDSIFDNIKLDRPDDPSISKDAVAIENSIIDKELNRPIDRSIPKDAVAIENSIIDKELACPIDRSISKDAVAIENSITDKELNRPIDRSVSKDAVAIENSITDKELNRPIDRSVSKDTVAITNSIVDNTKLDWPKDRSNENVRSASINSTAPSIQTVKPDDEYTQQITSVCLAIMHGIPDIPDFMCLYQHASSEATLSSIEAQGYHVIISKIGAHLDISDLMTIVADARKLNFALLPYNYEIILTRLLGAAEFEESACVLSDMRNHGFPDTKKVHHLMLHASLVCDAKNLIPLWMNYPQFTKDIDSSHIDQTLDVLLQHNMIDNIEEFLQIIKTIDIRLYPSNRCIETLINAYLGATPQDQYLPNAMFFFTHLALHRYIPSPSMYVALCEANIRIGNTRYARRILRSMAGANIPLPQDLRMKFLDKCLQQGDVGEARIALDASVSIDIYRSLIKKCGEDIILFTDIIGTFKDPVRDVPLELVFASVIYFYPRISTIVEYFCDRYDSDVFKVLNRIVDGDAGAPMDISGFYGEFVGKADARDIVLFRNEMQLAGYLMEDVQLQNVGCS